MSLSNIQLTPSAFRMVYTHEGRRLSAREAEELMKSKQAEALDFMKKISTEKQGR